MRQYQIITYPPPTQYTMAESMQGKFIQFTLQGVIYLIFAAKSEHRFHNQILAHFLAAKGLPHRWVENETLEIMVPDLTVMGGGRFSYEHEHNRLTLWDNSQAYGRFDEAGLEEGIHAAGHPWSGAEVMIQR